jgi:hypothetical protein
MPITDGMRSASANVSHSLVGVAVGFLLTGLVVGGCAATDKSDSQLLTVIGAAVEATQAAGTTAIDTTYTTGASSVPITEHTAYDYRRQIGEVTSPSVGVEILDGPTTYSPLSSDPSAGIGIPGKTWIADRLPHLGDNGLQAFNPATVPARLVAIIQAARKVGNETIHGVETTRYDLTLSAAGMKEILFFNPALKVSFRPASIWIDRDKRLRQIQVSYILPDEGLVTYTSTYVAFGIPVNVSLPADSQVETLEQYEKYICVATKSQAHPNGMGISVGAGPGSGPQSC